MNFDKKRAKIIAAYTLLFCLALCISLYTSFPYSVLKEYISSQIAEALPNSGVSVRIGELSPQITGGIVAHDVELSAEADASRFNLKSVEVGIKIWPLFLGRLGVEIEVEAPSGGVMRGAAQFGLLSLIRGTASMPARIVVKAKDFPTEEAVKFLLMRLASSPSQSPFLKPILSVITLTGKLNANVDFGFGSKDVNETKGNADMKLVESTLDIKDPPLNVVFTNAQLGATVENGVFAFSKNAGFDSSGLTILLDGKLTFRAPISASQMDLMIHVAMRDEVKENFENVVDLALTTMFGQSDAIRDGQFAVQLRGSIDHPVTTIN